MTLLPIAIGYPNKRKTPIAFCQKPNGNMPAGAGSSKKYGFGKDDEQLSRYAWFSGNSNDKTHPVGEKQPNIWGLYDMQGNVWGMVRGLLALGLYRGP